jgi:hypothetical protein
MKNKVKKLSKHNIDRIEKFNLILFSIVYWFIYGIIYGCVLAFAPETIIIFGWVPWNVHQTMLGIGLAFWGMCSLLLGLKYNRS